MTATAMALETAEAPQVVARLLEREAGRFAELGRILASMEPRVVATCARGSSDHAAGYLKYAIELTLGIPVASIGPSVASVYQAPLKMPGAVLVSISQSGQSPDIVALQARARDAGAFTIALVNVEDSPLAREAHRVLPLNAGAEHSVAATKSFVASVAAAAAFTAAWSGNAGLQAGVAALPDALAAALKADWSPAAETFRTASSLYVVGRGPGYPIAQEMALKCKETAALHAEAFSTAEVMHGPLQLLRERFPVLAVVPDDAAAATTRASLQRMIASEGTVFAATGLDMPGTRLPVAATGCGLTDPIATVTSFYRFIEAVARARGFDPDRPSRLSKVTETV